MPSRITTEELNRNFNRLEVGLNDTIAATDSYITEVRDNGKLEREQLNEEIAHLRVIVALMSCAILGLIDLYIYDSHNIHASAAAVVSIGIFVFILKWLGLRKIVG